MDANEFGNIIPIHKLLFVTIYCLFRIHIDLIRKMKHCSENPEIQEIEIYALYQKKLEIVEPQ